MSRTRPSAFTVPCLLAVITGCSGIGCVPAPEAGGPADGPPAAGWPVLAIFLGCQPLPPDAPVLADGVCLPGAAPTCRGRRHWCRTQDGTRHGPWLRLHPAGGADLLVRYWHGRRHGPWTQWYPDGGKMRAGGFFRGRKHGAWDGWHPNGQQAYHHAYDLGERHGQWTHWDPDGNPTPAH